MVENTGTVELKQVTTYVDLETYQKLERVRKRTSRSAFVANILSEVFADVELVNNTPRVKARIRTET